MKTLWTILKKELKRFFTDKRTLLSIFLPGIVLYLAYTLMGGIITDKAQELNRVSEATVCVINEPKGTDANGQQYDFKSFFNADVFKDTKFTFEENLSIEEAQTKIKDDKLDLYVVYENNFMTNVENYDFVASNGANAPKVNIYYKSTNQNSSTLANSYMSFLEVFEQSISNKFDINPDQTLQYDFAEEDGESAMILSMFVPFLLVVMLFSSSMGLCAESISGEKERGTIATLLNTPAKRWQLALGKVASLAVVCMCAGIASSAGAILSFPKLIGDSSISLAGYGFGTFALLAIMIIVTSVFFAAILSVVSTFAKSVKEASSLCLIPMMLTFGIGIFSMFGMGASENLALYLIPVFNSVQCFTQVLNMAINPLAFLIAILSNIVYIGLCVFGVSKMFNNEKIMFSR